MDFPLLISLLSEMDLHKKYWDVYEEMGQERWSNEFEDLSYQHFVDASAFGISQTIQQGFDAETSNNSISWTISLAVEPERAKIRCYSKYYYSEWPYCISLPNFYEKEVDVFEDLPVFLKQASEFLISNLFNLRREKNCRALWNAAQINDNRRLQDY